MEAKYTSGNWIQIKRQELSIVIQGNNKMICTVWIAQECDDAPKQDESRANAKLIAAAPDLLVALKGLCEYWEWMIKDPNFHEYINAKQAIKKATE